MYDYDAKNHLRDLRREAANERFAKQVEEAAETQPKKAARPSIITTSVKLLTGTFAR
jgi:ribosomal protein L29